MKKLRSEPNDQGFWGDYGGRFVAETLIAPLEELTTAYRSGPARSRIFRRQLDRPAAELCRTPHATLFRQAPDRNPGGARIWLKREDLLHTGAHKINNAWARTARARMGKAPHHRRNRRGPARRRHRHGLRAVRARMRGLHGRRRHAAPGAQRLPHAVCSAPKCRRRSSSGTDAERRDQRSHARLGHQRRATPITCWAPRSGRIRIR